MQRADQSRSHGSSDDRGIQGPDNRTLDRPTGDDADPQGLPRRLVGAFQVLRRLPGNPCQNTSEGANKPTFCSLLTYFLRVITVKVGVYL